MARNRFSGQGTHAYETLRRWILNGTLPPGSRLIVRKMANVLKTSNGPVRDALIELRNDRLIEGGHGPDWTVPELTVDMIDDGMMVRIALESQSARLCALNATPEDIQRLRVLAAEIDRREQRGQVDEEMNDGLDHRFHRLIAEIAGSNALREEIERWMVVMTWALIYLHGMRRRGKPHIKLVAAIATGDPDTAAEQMREHIEHPWKEKKELAKLLAIENEKRHAASAVSPKRAGAAEKR